MNDQLKIDEGFREKPYRDTLGVWTFGYGFTYITKEESEVVLMMRTEKLRKELAEDIKHLSPGRQDVILNMAYNLGETGVRNFKHMWRAIHNEDWNQAAYEMLDSKWAKQVGNRARRLALRMKNP